MTASEPVRRYTLPNRLEIAYQSKAELLQFYEDIFEKQVYTSRGVTLRDGDTVFDVGANIGLFTVFVAERWPGAQIYSFEPAPPLFAILRANTVRYGDRVHLFNCGLSSAAGEARLTFYPHSSGMSSFYPDERLESAALRTLIHNELARGRGEIEELLAFEDELIEQRLRSETWSCPLRTLEEVIGEQGVTRIDLLKIDVEKSEMDVLAGLDSADWSKVGQAVVEVHDLGSRLVDIQRMFRDHGFAVSVEQEELYQSSDRYNLYALRRHLRSDHAASLERIEERAKRLRDSLHRMPGTRK